MTETFPFSLPPIWSIQAETLTNLSFSFFDQLGFSRQIEDEDIWRLDDKRLVAYRSRVLQDEFNKQCKARKSAATNLSNGPRTKEGDLSENSSE